MYSNDYRIYWEVFMKPRIFAGCCALMLFSGFAIAQKKTISNADLEKFRAGRIKAEEDYRKNHRRMGLPSPEELEQIEAERQKSLRETALAAENERWQARYGITQRANSLKAEMASLDAEINYLSRSIGNIRETKAYYNFPQYQPIAGPQNYYRNPGNPFPALNRPIDFAPSTSNSNAKMAAALPHAQGENKPGRGGASHHNSYGQYAPPHFYYGGYAYSFPAEKRFYEKQELRLRLNNLRQQRAGLAFRWYLLSEEARLAGFRLD